MEKQFTLEQLAELPLVKDYLARQVAGTHEAQRAERLQMLEQKRAAEAECNAIDAEAEQAQADLDRAYKAWMSARGVCGAISSKRTAAGSRYQHAHKRLLDLGERTIEDAIRKIAVGKAAIESDIAAIEEAFARDAKFRPHEWSSKMKPGRRRELQLQLNANRDMLAPLIEALETVERMRLSEMAPTEIVERVALLIDGAGLESTNISGLRDKRQAA